MRALIVEQAGQARVVDVPEKSGDIGEAQLQVRMVGLCGTDHNTFRGRNAMAHFPRILGHEIAATVLSNSHSAGITAGTNVTLSPYTACGCCPSCLRGRANACQFNETLGVQREGGLTERIWVQEEKLYAANLPLRELALVEPLTVGFHAVSRGRVTANDTVAVFGCGSVGLGAISSSAFRGARTIAIDVDDTKLETARLAGATDLIHAGREGIHERLVELTGHGPDCIVEAIGLPETFRAAVEEVAFTGRVVYIGYAKEPVVYETRLFVQKELDILGSRNALPEDFREVIKMLQEGRFPVRETISVVAPMEEGPELLRQWSENPAKFTKILLEVS
jgi:threonine dehydrogenase-like Zn-dependent dehydrogenase